MERTHLKELIHCNERKNEFLTFKCKANRELSHLEKGMSVTQVGLGKSTMELMGRTLLDTNFISSH